MFVWIFLQRENVKRGKLEKSKQIKTNTKEQEPFDMCVCRERERPIISACSCMNSEFKTRPPHASIVLICKERNRYTQKVTEDRLWKVWHAKEHSTLLKASTPITFWEVLSPFSLVSLAQFYSMITLQKIKTRLEIVSNRFFSNQNITFP